MRAVPTFRRLIVLLALSAHAPLGADVVRDGSIGPDAGTQPAGPDFAIPQTMGELRGANLFHSFSVFDLSPAQSATFTAVSPVDNVISRVTGGPSTLDGTLMSTIPGAGFFLLNPAGILIGPEASIDIDGDLHLSSAAYLRFEDGLRFDTSAGGAPVLSAAEPAAFGFLGTAPATVVFDRSELELVEGGTLSVVAGGIEMTSAGDDPLVAAAGGRVRLVSVGADGEVTLDDAPDLGAFATLGDIRLAAAGSEDDTDDDDAPDDAADDAPEPAIDVSGDSPGLVLLRGANLSAADFSIAANNEGAADGAGGGIDARLRDSVALGGESQFASTAEGEGRGADVRIEAASIRLSEDSELLSDTRGAGAGGTVSLSASDIRLSDDAEIASDTEAGGAGGGVRIDTDRLTLTDNTEISSDTDPASTGTGGSVQITARGSIEMQIVVAPGEQAGVFTNSEGGGNAGTISITTPSLGMSGGSITAETSAGGTGGGVALDAARVVLANGAEISARSSGADAGAGDAGNVTLVNVADLTVGDGSSINTRSNVSDGGNIAITGNGLVLLRGGEITANVNDGVGGNVDITSDTVIIDRSRVVAQAGAGQGGAITIDARRLFRSASVISASAGPAGISGTVDINAPEVDLSGSLSQLPSEFLDAASLLRATCAARAGNRTLGSFVVASRRGLPATVEGLPLQRAGLVDETPAVTLPESATDARLAIATGDDSLALDALRRSQLEIDDLHGADQVYSLIHIANSYRQLAVGGGSAGRERLLAAHDLLQKAISAALVADDARALSYAYGNLALLYESRQRVREALFLSRNALAAAERAAAPESQYRWHWLEGRLLWAQGQAAAAVRAYRRAVEVLDATRQEAFTRSGEAESFFRRSIAPVYTDLVDALLQGASLLGDGAASQSLLLQVRATVEQYRAAELRDYFSDPCVAELQARSTDLEQVAPGTAVIYPIVLDERMELLLSLPDGVHRHTVAVAGDRLTREIRRFRLALQRPGTDTWMRHSQRLYEWLLEPLRADLGRFAIDTLVFVPDGALRTIPFAALHDGEEFLVRRYALAVTPGLDLIDPKPLNRAGMKLLLLGLSESVQGFSALPNVPRELRAVQETFGGELLLDATFSNERLESALRDNQPTVVHLASHAQFGGGPQSSFVLTYDGRINMDTLAEYVGLARFREQPLELLVLSACETAVGDDRAALGLAGVAVKSGARSALGSLWPIADEAAYRLIVAFYRQLLDPTVSKAVALQRAQLRLLAQAQFRHPFFWSPFLLISNWL